MKTEDIIQALRRMATETGSLNCLGCGHEHNCSFHGCAVLMEAANRLEQLNTFGADKEGVYYENRTDHSAGS